MMNRPFFIGAGLLAAGLATGDCSGVRETPVHERPNILLFLVDDMGWQDTSVPFHSERTPFNDLYQTPNMERLAAAGMKFTQAYACSVCSPTRTSLMTGMNAARHGVTNWTLRRNQSVDRPDELLDFPLWNVNGLQPAGCDSIDRSVAATTLPQLLRANGYTTIHCGKAHWGAIGTSGADPLKLGFEVNIAGHAAGGRGGELHTHNLPLRSGKGSAYEGGIREPMIVSWPGKVKPATVCHDYLIIEDFFPTILEMAGVKKYKTVQKVDGISFVSRLLEKKSADAGNPSADERDLVWHFPNKWGPTGPGIGTTSTIRHGDWKLVYWYKDGRKELFNIREDIGEKNDVASLHPDVVADLSVRLGNQLRSVGALRPSFKSSGSPAPWPDENK